MTSILNKLVSACETIEANGGSGGGGLGDTSNFATKEELAEKADGSVYTSRITEGDSPTTKAIINTTHGVNIYTTATSPEVFKIQFKQTNGYTGSLTMDSTKIVFDPGVALVDFTLNLSEGEISFRAPNEHTLYFRNGQLTLDGVKVITKTELDALEARVAALEAK